MQNIEQKGGVHMDQHRRVLITQEWNPILKRFDFPPTEAGYEAMKTGIRQFAENEYVRSCCHEVEGLCGAPPGSYFGVPTIEEMAARAEEKRKAEEEAAKRIEAEKRQAEEEARKRKEEEESRRKQEEEARQKREEEEAKRRQEEEEAREKKRKEEEEEAKRREEEEEATRRKQEEETQRKEEEETKMNEEEARQRKKEEEVTAEKEKEAQRSVEDAMTANVAVDKEGEEPASQLSRRDEEEGKCPQPDQEGQSHEQADINKSPEELNDSSGSQVGANLCNSHEDPERQRQIEEEKRIVNGDAKLEADREAAAKRSSEGVTGTADTAGQAGEAASPSINDAENGTLNGHAAVKNQVEEEPRENVSTHQALRPLPVLRAPDSGSEALGVVLREAVVQGVAEGPWLRLLPCSCRTLGVLGDRGYLPLEELQPVTSVTWSCLPMGAAGRFKVRAKHVAVRAHPELRGKVVGVVVAGRMLMGTPHRVAGYLWLRFEESSRKKVGDEEAWALVQDLGGDVLLEPLDADGRRALSNFQGSQAQAADPQTAGSDKVGATAVPPAPTVEKLPTPVTDPVKVSQRVEAAALARKQLKGPLEFRVLAEDHSAPVRKEPLVQSPQLGKLERGELVYGYPGGGWLQLMHSELENSWVFIGTRLSAVWAELRVTARSWNALEVTWPGLHEEKRVAYNVEWRTPEGAAKQMKGHKVSASNKVVLGNLPSGLLCFRVGARVAGAGNNDDQDVKLWGPWAELVAGED
ncbi:unnamed protein product [Cladocopium goreaui]|uniref:Reticulocyte-binding protein homolog 2a (PfR2Ha) (PfRH2a) [Cleaved into: Reticulocyte-binding protein homolog 2a 85 kDa form Reticulocyte-binding protein homolog 2a 285 kDa form] n=1 Tax=Cladocopium goreaui TaxID=2562237 RepID=A0A9P1CG03_9DINO|nr:unnamed protein product [Cladocopium goreaui]